MKKYVLPSTYNTYKLAWNRKYENCDIRYDCCVQRANSRYSGSNKCRISGRAFVFVLLLGRKSENGLLTTVFPPHNVHKSVKQY